MNMAYSGSLRTLPAIILLNILFLYLFLPFIQTRRADRTLLTQMHTFSPHSLVYFSDKRLLDVSLVFSMSCQDTTSWKQTDVYKPFRFFPERERKSSEEPVDGDRNFISLPSKIFISNVKNCSKFFFVSLFRNLWNERANFWQLWFKLSDKFLSIFWSSIWRREV